ncbi:hypothetical protein WA577_007361 [Blastocystis sp. JDR]
MPGTKKKGTKQYPKLTEHDDLGKTVTLFSSTLFNLYLRKDMVKQIHTLEERRRKSQLKMRSTMNSLVSEDHPSQVLLNDVQMKSVEEKEVMTDSASLREENGAEMPVQRYGEERKRDQGDDPVKPEM